VLNLYGLLCIRIRPRYPMNSELEPKAMAIRKVQVLYFHPRTTWPTREAPNSAMKKILAAIFGA